MVLTTQKASGDTPPGEKSRAKKVPTTKRKPMEPNPEAPNVKIKPAGILKSREPEDTPDSQNEAELQQKKKRSTMSENKRKSLKHKERKRKKKLDSLRSTMPKEELEEALKPSRPEESVQQMALSYLRLWKSARTAWKFNKLRQTWLLQHLYDSTQIVEKDFEILLEYIQPLKGAAKATTSQEAQKMLDKHQSADSEKSLAIVSRTTRVLQMLD